MPYASSMSTHEDLGVAAAETIGQVLDKLGSSPDFAIVFMSGYFKKQITKIQEAVNKLLTPTALMGCTADAVICGGQEVENQSALTLFAGNLDGKVSPIRISDSLDLSNVASGSPAGADAHTMLLLADPFSFPAEAAIDRFQSTYPNMKLIGGLISSAQTHPIGSLFLDGEIYRDGAVALLIGGEVQIEPLVSQGCRPIGTPLIVTKSEGNLVHELGGQPALQRLEGIFASMDESERLQASHGLHVGRVIDEHQTDFTSGDFLIRAVIGADSDKGLVAIGDAAPVGSTIQFQIRDARTASDDLVHKVSQLADGDGALLFTCNGRGTNLFESPNHDASRIASCIPGEVVAGMFCAGEIGPVSTQSFLHGYTASAAIFHD